MMSEARRSNLVQCEETWGYVPAYFSGIARRCHAVYCNVGVGYALQPVERTKAIRSLPSRLAILCFAAAILLVRNGLAFAGACGSVSGGIGLENANQSLSCASAMLKRNDALMNSTYRKLVRVLKDEPGDERYAKSQVIAAQRAWVAFRDSECDFRVSLAGGARQWSEVNRTECMSELTMDRTDALSKYFQQANDR
ncbi:lysozyme inhibitor LprI family protein [Paraburkholderia caledonica]|uniref:lysozyme inhibitor LprI family protein n=1 Tax=Paraburkholderia caledonica TaxID=134536 RepID=UPI000B48EE4A|nr:hypothetical protein BWU74_22775 [Burkholderia sp. Bk]